MSESTGLLNLSDLSQASQVTHLLCRTSSGEIKWVNADNLQILRGIIPSDKYRNIDDRNLPGGVYEINGAVEGTLPPDCGSEGAARLENWRAVNAPRMQILHTFWKDRSYIRRYKSNVWQDWVLFDTSEIS